MPYDLNADIYFLLRQEPFFATFSRHIDKVASTAIPTAGVKVNSSSHQFEMLYNPSFFEGLTDAERIDVIKHEFYHVIFDHVTTRLPAEGMSKMWNIATDLAINSHLPNIPSMACIAGKPNTPFANYPPNESADFYFEMLKNDKNLNKEENNSFDDHEGWGESDNTVNEIAKENLKDILKKASEEANKSSWGSVSSEIRQQIMDKLTSVICWRKMLRYFVKVSQRSDKNSTIRKINKRYPRIHAGKKVQRVANIAISIDQSGSVSDEMLAMFFTELNNLSSIAAFTVIPFDTNVDEKLVFTWKKGQRRVWERVMCGGTNFDAPTKYVNEGIWDGHIVLTDMQAPKPIPSRCKRMWLTDKTNYDHPYFKTSEIVVPIVK